MIAGAIGAAARYGLDGLISIRTGTGFPWGIFVVNISGAFALGLIYTVMTSRLTVDPAIRIWVTTGFLGAYTTFSTLTLETVQLLQTRSYGLAVLNSAGSLAVGLVAAGAGVALGSVL